MQYLAVFGQRKEARSCCHSKALNCPLLFHECCECQGQFSDVTLPLPLRIEGNLERRHQFSDVILTLSIEGNCEVDVSYNRKVVGPVTILFLNNYRGELRKS